MPAERASGTKRIGRWVVPRLILNALGYRQESLTPTDNRVTDSLVSCSLPDHYIDNLFIFNIYLVTWYDYVTYTYKFSLSEKNYFFWVFTSQYFRPFFCPLRICTSFARFRIFLFLCFISQLPVPLLCHVLTPVSYNICTISNFICPSPRYIFP